jgi:hypothetical protein
MVQSTIVVRVICELRFVNKKIKLGEMNMQNLRVNLLVKLYVKIGKGGGGT